MKTLIASLLVLAAAADVPQPQAPAPIDYRFDEVNRKVTLTTADKAVKVVKGQHAQGGDKVQTGWFSYALLSSERYRAKFEIFSATDVKLAEGTPGVILSLERGRLHAMFDKITGSEPRIVQTPGALLAVRGTQYDVIVADDGKTTLEVWEGTVSIASSLRPDPVLVHAGEAANFSRREPPQARPMTQNERDGGPGGRGNPNGGNPNGGNRGPGQDGQGHDPHGGDHGGPQPPGGKGNNGPPPPPPPPPPGRGH
jgi:hypothetical protein